LQNTQGWRTLKIVLHGKARPPAGAAWNYWSANPGQEEELENMSKNIGKFIWYDVMTTDTKAAESFYRSVIGWTAKDSGVPDRSYTLFSAGPTMVAGLMPIPVDARATGVPPCWTGSVAVDDVDAFAARVKTAGGSIRRPPEDIPGVGRFAVAADPHGAVFILFQPSSDEEPASAAPRTPGHIGWHELYAGNLDAAWAFYAGLFHWTKGEAMDMGPMGIYQLFSIGGVPVGGMMTKPPQVPAPFWAYYFNVEGADAAVARVTQGGGKIANGPMQVPGGSWIVQCFDPQGAFFSIIAPKR
jgi:predicted enzyme related to lactoylglutathione lyase